MLSLLNIAYLICYKKKQVSFNFMAAVNICSDFGAQKIKSVTVSTVSPSISHEVMGLDAMIFVFWMLSFTFIKSLFSSSSLYAIKGDVIFISEVIDISSSNLDSSLCFLQPSVSYDVLCI